jgi:tetratricopeptide (TPR) repeat protein
LAVLCGCGFQGTEEPKPAKAPEASATPSQGSVLGRSAMELLSAAAAAEKESRFDDAAQLRRQLRALLAEEHGANHWLVVNCDLAIDGDERLARLDADGRAAMQRFKVLEQQTAQFVRQGSLSGALESIRQAQPIATQIFGPRGGLTLRLHLTAGQLAADLGRWEDARKDFEAALQIASQIFPSPHPDWELAYSQCGIANRECGRTDEAIEQLLEARGMAEQIGGRDASWAMRTHELGVTLHRAGRREDALQELQLAEQIRRSLLGDQHPIIAESLVSQAAVLMELGNWSAASDLLLAAEPITAAQSSSTSLWTDVQLHLATICSSQRDFAAAAEYLEKALEALDRKSGRWSLGYAHVGYRLGMCRGFLRQFDAAEPLFRHALDVQRNLLGIDHEQTRKTLRALSELLARTGREGEADAVLGEHTYTAGNLPQTSDQKP